jgi:HrpA-like RNA helicase
MTKVKMDLKDPLDSKGKNLNFINNNKYSNEYKELAKKWSTLPIYKESNIKKIFNLIDKNQVILLTSGTGSGKTVIMPKLLIRYFMSKGLTGKVATTNPKIITTQNNAIYAAQTLDVELGDFVGCKYRNSNPEMISDKSKLLYVTDGLILAIINGGDILLKDYNGVIIDEAHERQINIDILLKYLKDIVLARDDFKIIVMSATINSSVFKKYFKHKKIKFGEIDITSTPNFPIQQYFSDITQKDFKSDIYLMHAVNKCLDIIDNSEDGDIIVFIPKTKDASKGCKMLADKCPTYFKTKQSICDKLFCVSVYAAMSEDTKELAVNKDLYKNRDSHNKYNRKIIFATNTAESSITFDGLVYVIDTGLEFANYYDVKQNTNILLTRYTSQAQIKQRIGRAGRTQPGIAYHLYKKNEYSKFNKYPEPSIMTINLTDTLLSIINLKLNINNTITFISDLLTPVRMDQFYYSISKLHFVNALKLIDNNNNIINYNDINYNKYKNKKLKDFKLNGTITTLGRMMLKFKINYLNALAIIISKFYNCMDEMLIIISIIETVDGQLNLLFNYNNKEKYHLLSYFNKDVVNDSDHLTIYNIFIRYYMNASNNENPKYINTKICSQILNTYKKLKLIAEKMSEDSFTQINEKYLQLTTNTDNMENRILLTLSISHKYNTLYYDNNKFNTMNWLENQSAPCEFFFLTPHDKPEKVICHNLINISNNKKFTIISKINNL